MWTLSPRSLGVLVAAFVVLFSGTASAQPGWNTGPTIVKKCPRCGYQTENLSETTCPNCSANGGRRSNPAPSTSMPPTGGMPGMGGGDATSPFGASSSGGGSNPNDGTTKPLTMGENITIALGVFFGGLVAIIVLFGAIFLVVYLKNNVGKKAAKPAKKAARRSRRRDEDDDDDDD